MSAFDATGGGSCAADEQCILGRLKGVLSMNVVKGRLQLDQSVLITFLYLLPTITQARPHTYKHTH